VTPQTVCQFAQRTQHVKGLRVYLTAAACFDDPNKMLSYRRETARQGALVLAKSGRLELGDSILRTL